jgi:hypothetical protein
MKPGDELETNDLLPTWDDPEATVPPVAVPVPEGEVTGQPPLAIPVAGPLGVEVVPTAQPVAALTSAVPSATLLCPVCGSPRAGDAASCTDFGYYFTPADLAGSGGVKY